MPHDPDAPVLVCQDVGKTWGLGTSRETKALAGIDLVAHRQEVLAVVGPSGCGKSTLLSLIAGLEVPTTGTLVAHGQSVVGPSPDRMLVFQEPSLFPWLSVWENVSFGLSLRGVGRAECLDAARSILGKVALADFMHFRPDELSLGMRQRVAVARALALKPRLLLLDEPFAALDAQTRKLMQRFLLDVQRISDAAIVLVTHDIDEAVALADRVLVMTARPGRIKAEIPVTEPRPRDPFAQGYLHAARTVAEALRDEVDIAFSRETRLPH